MSVQDMVLLGSAVVPPIVAAVLCLLLWRSGKRHDARAAGSARGDASPEAPRAVISDRLERRVRVDFLPGEVQAVLTRLASLRLAMAERQSLERIQAAIVVLAAGDRDRLMGSAAEAEQDWRDVLVPSGLGDADWPERLDHELGVPTTNVEF